MPIVKLTNEEIAEANAVAKGRHGVNRGVGRHDHKVMSNGMDADIQGCLGEMVVSKYLGLPWDGKLKTNEEWLEWRNVGHDVSGLEVRFTKHEKGRLIVHPKDKDRSIFVLVVQSYAGAFDIVGWCFGFEAKKTEYWEDVGRGRPCFYMPRHKMRDVSLIVQNKLKLVFDIEKIREAAKVAVVA